MPVTINTGTTIGVSATLPATFDSGGYAVPVITLVGEIVDVGEIAKAFAIVAHQSITRLYPQKMKDTMLGKAATNDIAESTLGGTTRQIEEYTTIHF